MEQAGRKAARDHRWLLAGDTVRGAPNSVGHLPLPFLKPWLLGESWSGAELEKYEGGAAIWTYFIARHYLVTFINYFLLQIANKCITQVHIIDVITKRCFYNLYARKASL